MIKVAYLATPFAGGTWRRFTVLRGPLLQRGIDFQCTFVGADRWGRQVDGLSCWDLPADGRAATVQLIDRLHREGFRAVFVPVLGNVRSANSLRYLPESLARFAIGVGITRSQHRQVACLAPHCDQVVAVSDRVAEGLRSHGVDQAKLVTIWNGVEIPQEIRLRTRKDNSAVRLVYVGRLEDIEKGVLFLPPMLRELRGLGVAVHLDVIGSGGSEGRLIEQARRLGVLDAMTLRGELPHRDVLEAMAESEMLVVPSRVEGFGFVAAEAMSAGCVPIVHDIRGSLSSIVEDGVSGCVVPVGDVRGMAHRIAGLVRDPDRYARMRGAAFARVAAMFSVDRMADGYAELIRKAADPSQTHPKPLDLAGYDVPAAFQRGWWTRLPTPVRSTVRALASRYGRSL